MDPIDSKTSNAEAINPTDLSGTCKVAQRLESPYISGSDSPGDRVVRARQIAARAYCKLDQGDLQTGKEELREIMQLLDGELEAGR